MRTLHQSGDHWYGRGVGVLGGGEEAIDSRVRGGRNSRDFGYMGDGVLKVHLPLNIGEEDENGLKEGLEEFHRDTSLKESAKLSQHKELQDLEPYTSKTV